MLKLFYAFQRLQTMRALPWACVHMEAVFAWELERWINRLNDPVFQRWLWGQLPQSSFTDLVHWLLVCFFDWQPTENIFNQNIELMIARPNILVNFLLLLSFLLPDFSILSFRHVIFLTVVDETVILRIVLFARWNSILVDFCLDLFWLDLVFSKLTVQFADDCNNTCSECDFNVL